MQIKCNYFDFNGFFVLNLNFKEKRFLWNIWTGFELIQKNIWESPFWSLEISICQHWKNNFYLISWFVHFIELIWSPKGVVKNRTYFEKKFRVEVEKLNLFAQQKSCNWSKCEYFFKITLIGALNGGWKLGKTIRGINLLKFSPTLNFNRPKSGKTDQH